MTTTNLIRNTIVAENAEETTQRLATFANLSWLIFITLELIFKWTHPIVIILMVFRLWEIVVINIWIFVFKQGASKSENTEDIENNVRLFILLLFQYFTIILMFASIYYILFVTDLNNFTINSGNDYGYSIITWIYFPIITIATTGYGDIFPVTNIARISTSLEILLGMFFILIHYQYTQ